MNKQNIARDVASNARNGLDGAAREVKTISRRAARSGRQMAEATGERLSHAGQVVGQQLRGASDVARRHPWAGAALLAMGLAVVGGLLFSRRR